MKTNAPARPQSTDNPQRLTTVRDSLYALTRQLQQRNTDIYLPLELELGNRLKTAITTKDAAILEDLSATLRPYQHPEEDSLVSIRDQRDVARANLAQTPGYTDKGKEGAKQLIYKDVTAHEEARIKNRAQIDSWALTNEQKLLDDHLTRLGFRSQDDITKFVTSPPTKPNPPLWFQFWKPSRPSDTESRIIKEHHIYVETCAFLKALGDRPAALFQKQEERRTLWQQEAQYRQEEAEAHAKYLALLRNIENANLTDAEICNQIRRSAMMSMLHPPGKEIKNCFTAVHARFPDIVTPDMLLLAEDLSQARALLETTDTWSCDAGVKGGWPDEWDKSTRATSLRKAESFLSEFPVTPDAFLDPQTVRNAFSRISGSRQPTPQIPAPQPAKHPSIDYYLKG